MLLEYCYKLSTAEYEFDLYNYFVSGDEMVSALQRMGLKLKLSTAKYEFDLYNFFVSGDEMVSALQRMGYIRDIDQRTEIYMLCFLSTAKAEYCDIRV